MADIKISALTAKGANLATTDRLAIAVTIPTNASVAFSTGTQILFSQHGAGQVTFAAAGGVTVRAAGGKLKTTAQYSMGSLIKIATDEWYITGDLTT